MKGPSRTAWGVAAHRAAHQVVEGGAIFQDPFARTILGPDADSFIEAQTAQGNVLRLFVAVRARFAEDALAQAVARGVRQIVVLGAGLDTFALRNPYSELLVFEVDHPDTQHWKREQMARMSLPVPANLRFVPVDFERQALAGELERAKFDSSKAAFFMWLGVVPYLTRDAILATLGFIAAIPEGEVAFDYTEPLESYTPEARIRAETIRQRAAEMGEPWLSEFTPSGMAELLTDQGFSEIEDLGPAEIAARFFQQPGQPRRSGPHVVRARRG